MLLTRLAFEEAHPAPDPLSPRRQVKGAASLSTRHGPALLLRRAVAGACFGDSSKGRGPRRPFGSHHWHGAADASGAPSPIFRGQARHGAALRAVRWGAGGAGGP